MKTFYFHLTLGGEAIDNGQRCLDSGFLIGARRWAIAARTNLAFAEQAIADEQARLKPLAPHRPSPIAPHPRANAARR